MAKHPFMSKSLKPLAAKRDGLRRRGEPRASPRWLGIPSFVNSMRFFLCRPGTPVARAAQGAAEGLVKGPERHCGGDFVEAFVDIVG